MRILHTSDWHLGKNLYERKRYEEFEAFLNWLGDIINEEKIDALLVAGDVFDIGAPGTHSQELYYRFLTKVSVSGCRNIVIIAGNHDSPSFLEAPKEILRILNVIVVGAVTDNPEDEVFLITGNEEQDRAIICAVPYLRDKDVRIMTPGENIEDKNNKIMEGVKSHYLDVVKKAEEKRERILSGEKSNRRIPIIGMGHLFAADNGSSEGEGVRQIYKGFLSSVASRIFSDSLDYLALGHLHVSQIVGGASNIRYSGSPIPMGFGEANQEKIVIIVEFTLTGTDIKEIKIPRFKQLERIAGDIDKIKERLNELMKDNSRAWVEIEYTGENEHSGLNEELHEFIKDFGLEILRIKNRKVFEGVLEKYSSAEELEDLDPNSVFERLLDSKKVNEERRDELREAYKEIIQFIQEGREI